MAGIRIIKEPRVYLVGRTQLVWEGLDAFFRDENIAVTLPDDRRYGAPPEQAERRWQTDTVNEAELLCMVAGKICYDAYGKGRSNIQEYLANIIESRHGSVLEHPVWNFIIAGVSRVFSHEHVRHRAGIAISQRSQRYVKETDAGQILAEYVEQNPEALKIWQEAVAQAQAAYDRLVEILTTDLQETIPDRTLRIKTVRSAARSVMPNATETYLLWSANARALRHYIEMRASEHAEVEIRRVAVQILKIMQREAPTIFGDYVIRTLPDGSEVAETKNTKV